MTEATASLGSKIHVGDGTEPTEAFAPVAEARDWAYGKTSATEEATSHDSDEYREHIHTIFEQPDITFEVNWIATETTHARLAAIQASKKPGTFRFYDVDDAGDPIDGVEVSCLVTNITRNRPVVGVLRNSITLKPTGKPVDVAGS